MIVHLALAILIQLGIASGLRNWSAGAAAAAAWFVSREITQAEYRWIEQFGGGRRANMPWWGGLDPQVWHKLDPWLDWLIPSIAVIAIALVARHRGSRQVRSGL